VEFSYAATPWFSFFAKNIKAHLALDSLSAYYHSEYMEVI